LLRRTARLPGMITWISAKKNRRKRNDDDQDGLFVDMPAEEERHRRAHDDRVDEIVIDGEPPELQQRGLAV
jgi:hypothetical protein